MYFCVVIISSCICSCPQASNLHIQIYRHKFSTKFRHFTHSVSFLLIDYNQLHVSINRLSKESKLAALVLMAVAWGFTGTRQLAAIHKAAQWACAEALLSEVSGCQLLSMVALVTESGTPAVAIVIAVHRATLGRYASRSRLQIHHHLVVHQRRPRLLQLCHLDRTLWSFTHTHTILSL